MHRVLPAAFLCYGTKSLHRLSLPVSRQVYLSKALITLSIALTSPNMYVMNRTFRFLTNYCITPACSANNFTITTCICNMHSTNYYWCTQPKYILIGIEINPIVIIIENQLPNTTSICTYFLLCTPSVRNEL